MDKPTSPAYDAAMRVLHDGGRDARAWDVSWAPEKMQKPLLEALELLGARILELEKEHGEAIRQRDEIASSDFPLWGRLLSLARGDATFGRRRVVESIEARITELERAARTWYDGDGHPVELGSAEEVTRRRIEAARELGKMLAGDAAREGARDALRAEFETCVRALRVVEGKCTCDWHAPSGTPWMCARCNALSGPLALEVKNA